MERQLTGLGRELLASVGPDELVSGDGRTNFRTKLHNIVRKRFDPFGIDFEDLVINKLEDHNAVVQVLKDGRMVDQVQDGYLELMGREKYSEMKNDADAKVAAQDKEGTIKTNDRAKEIAESNAALEVYKQERHLAEKKAAEQTKQEAELYKIEYERSVQEAQFENKLRQQRATEITRATVEAEKLNTEAEGRRKAAITMAQGDADAMRLRAEATRFAGEQEAAVEFAKLKAKADGLLKQAEALDRMAESFGGDKKIALMYALGHEGVLTDIVKANAEGLKNSNPSFTYVGGSDKKTGGDFVQECVKSLPGALAIMQNTTGIDLTSVAKSYLEATPNAEKQL